MGKYKTIIEYALAIPVCLVIEFWTLELWRADINIPFVYVADALFSDALVKGMIDNGWYLQNNYLGAPFFAPMSDYPITNNLDFIFFKLLSLISKNYAFVINAYFLLTFPLITLASIFAMRQFKISYPIALVIGLLYAFLPYHFWRGEGHLFLSAYYMVPLIIMVVLWVAGGLDLSFDKKSVISIAICILSGAAFVYYPVFACFFLAVAGIIAGIQQKRWVHIRTSLILISVILLVFMINISPHLIYQYEHGANPAVAARQPFESEYFGLKIIQLLLPQDQHRLGIFSRIAQYYMATAPLCNTSAPALGLIFSMGFLSLLGWAFYRILGEPDRGLLSKLAILNLSGLLLATVGGFGAVLAYLISPSIRAWMIA